MALHLTIVTCSLLCVFRVQANTVTAHFWRPEAADFVYPEVDSNSNDPNAEYLAGKEDFGIAFGGGGLRGAALTHGLVRSLRHADILQKTRYMSVSSGSVWLGTALQFQTQDSTEAFLGTSMPPEELSPDALVGSKAGSYITRLKWPIEKFPKGMKQDEQLQQLTATFLEANASRQAEFELLHGLERGIMSKILHCFENLCSCIVDHVIPDGSLHEMWTLLSSYVVMHPFGLATPNSAYAHASRIDKVKEELGARTKIYSSQDLKENFPFLLSQSAVMSLHSGSNQTYDPLLAYPLDNTPMYTGMPVGYSGSNVSAGEPYKKIGDLLLEPFGFDSDALEALPQSTTGMVKVRPRHNVFNVGQLSEWAGTATCYAAAFQIRPQMAKKPECEITAFTKIMPQARLWSPLEVDRKGVPVGNNLMVGDAGIFDDMGHLPLLRRRVKKLVIYDSSAVHDNSTGVDAVNMNEMVYLLAAFGQPGGLVPPNPAGSPNPMSRKDFLTVFEPTEFFKLWSKAKELHEANKPVVIHDTFTVVDNPWFGIVGGWKVEVVWVLAMPVAAWRNALPTTTQVNLPSWFPNVLAAEANSQFELSVLSQYGSWLNDNVVLEEIRKMLSKSKSPGKAKIDSIFV